MMIKRADSKVLFFGDKKGGLTKLTFRMLSEHELKNASKINKS